MTKHKYKTFNQAATGALHIIVNRYATTFKDKTTFDRTQKFLSNWVTSISNGNILDYDESIVADVITQTAAESVRYLTTIGYDYTKIDKVLCQKQHDYGHRNISQFGLVGVAIRLADKLARIENLTKAGTTAKNESLTDSYVDIIGYAMIAIMWVECSFQLKLEK